MKRHPINIWGDKSAAVAPIVAMSLFGLIAVGGIAFDYARLASLDTELQDAADQAALAAATQLDQQPNAIARATAAATGLLANQTLAANDSNAAHMSVNIPTVLFYATKAAAEADNGTDCPTANTVTADATAKFACVRTMDRVAKYALTPIAAAFSSGNIAAMAVAGLGSAICKVPPVMICNPDEPSGNKNKNYPFDANALAGHGLKLVTVGNGNTAWAPGNFGYLDTGSSTSNPNVELRQALGWVTAPGDCSGLDGVKTRTGAGTSVTPALNTRFDIYEKVTGGATADSCPGGANCPPSINTTKDLVRKAAPQNDKKCDFKTGEWEEPANPYLAPSNGSDLPITTTPDAMGHPRDKCHAISITGNCTYNGVTPSKIGDGAWDRNAYFRANYGWSAANWHTYVATGSEPIPMSNTTPSRYLVYKWEIANRGATIGGNVILNANGRNYGSGSNKRTDYDQPVCSQQQGYGSGITPGGSNVDRRRISGAVLNCNAWDVHGGGGTVYPVLKWVEYFLVEPSLDRASGRTQKNDVYVEIIGETTMGAGSTAGQVVRRDVPYLVK